MAVTLTFLVGRNKLFREGLKSLLSGSQFEVVGEADDVSQARAPLGDRTPSVVRVNSLVTPKKGPARRRGADYTTASRWNDAEAPHQHS